MSSNDRESALVVRAAEGDPVALKLLLTKTRARLRAYISVQIPADVARVVDPEDIVQDTHGEVFRRIRTFESRGEDSFFRFTAAVAVNRLRNLIKSHRALKRGGGRAQASPRKKNIDDSSVDLFALLSGHGHTPSRSVARGEAIGAVQVALADLPEHYRQAIKLVHIEGKPVREVALAMGRTERAIHGLCRRALKMMQGQLGTESKFFSSPG
jgi:RNA polymerase sigma factor (sigma-70 family)